MGSTRKEGEKWLFSRDPLTVNSLSDWTVAPTPFNLESLKVKFTLKIFSNNSGFPRMVSVTPEYDGTSKPNSCSLYFVVLIVFRSGRNCSIFCVVQIRYQLLTCYSLILVSLQQISYPFSSINRCMLISNLYIGKK